jgi:hypothetical protein
LHRVENAYHEPNKRSFKGLIAGSHSVFACNSTLSSVTIRNSFPPRTVMLPGFANPFKAMVLRIEEGAVCGLAIGDNLLL